MYRFCFMDESGEEFFVREESLAAAAKIAHHMGYGKIHLVALPVPEDDTEE